MFEEVDYKTHQVGIADANNFYASCERVFRPDLRGVPIAVLSNNDGVIIARSAELKALDVDMAKPYFKIKDLLKKHNVAIFSSNYELYGDMSDRVMSQLAMYAPEVEVYSIDESFLNFSGMQQYDMKEYGEKIVKEITQGTGIPISLGIAPTKTLAKLANKFAKKYPGYKGACVIDTPERHIRALQLTEVSTIWGVGDAGTKTLNEYSIKTAYDFIQAPRKWVRRKFTVMGERMWEELRGVQCNGLVLEPEDKKSITTSRSFGTMTSNKEDVKEAVANFAALCAAKLRKQKSCATHMMVFLHTNNFRPNLPQYAQNIVITFPTPINLTSEIIHYALDGIDKIFLPNFLYKKAGVTILGIEPEAAVQQNLFDPTNREKSKLIMPVLDKFNSGFNRNLIMNASQFGVQNWKMKQAHRSPCYTTRPEDFIRVKL